MKVKFGDKQKMIIYAAQVPAARQIIKDLKEDDLSNYFNSAITAASGSCGASFEMLKAEAEIARNQDVYDRYFEGSGDLDVWVTYYGYNMFYGFFEVRSYLSDLWDCDGTKEYYDGLKRKSFIVHCPSPYEGGIKFDKKN